MNKIPEVINCQILAAEETVSTGLYISWIPHYSCVFTSDVADEIRDGKGQCSRVGSSSVCLCGHLLLHHNPAKVPKSSGYVKPPTCKNCRCQGFSYCPTRPEETGQVWLLHRKDFNINTWQTVSSLLLYV
jgi:hypothetical protein